MVTNTRLIKDQIFHVFLQKGPIVSIRTVSTRVPANRIAPYPLVSRKKLWTHSFFIFSLTQLYVKLLISQSKLSGTRTFALKYQWLWIRFDFEISRVDCISKENKLLFQHKKSHLNNAPAPFSKKYFLKCKTYGDAFEFIYSKAFLFCLVDNHFLKQADHLLE